MFDETNLKSAYNQAIIISIAFFFSLAVYAGVAEIVLVDIQIDLDPSVYSIIKYVFIVIAAGQIIMMLFLKNRILSNLAKFSGNTLNQSDTNQSQEKGETQKVDERQFIQRLSSVHIITYAFCESIAVYGIVLFILGKNKTEFYTFLGACAFMMMINYPKYEDWKNWLRDIVNDRY